MDQRFHEYAEALRSFEEEGRLRRLPAENCARLIDLSSNDYLGLAGEFSRRLYESLRSRDTFIPHTSSASRLLAQGQKEAVELEALLSENYGRPALLFNSGYHANTGIIPALAMRKTMIVADRLVHASMIDGIRLSQARFARFRHNDLNDLEKNLLKARKDGLRPIVLTESVFSMDGDRAPLAELVALKHTYPEMILYVDEAHGLGAFGNRGLGLCGETGLLDEIDILVGTFGKAVASEGAFVICNSVVRDYLINTARSLIFSTSLSPVTHRWTRRMFEAVIEAHDRRRRLREISGRVRDALREAGADTGDSSTHIIPVITGSAASAVSLSERFAKRGICALPIRRPTVPEGSARVRISLNAALTDEEVERIINSFREELCG